MTGFDPKLMKPGVKFLGSFENSPPLTMLPEVAFIGRSNVGKSSLLNSLTSAKIAVTSKTPGRTQHVNLFAVKDDNGKVSVYPVHHIFIDIGTHFNDQIVSTLAQTLHPSWPSCRPLL